MIRVVGQASQMNGSSPTWTLTGICRSASRTGTGTYTITCDKNYTKVVVLISAERAQAGTERITADWSDNVLTIRNYNGQSSKTLGDCWITATFIENLPDKQTSILKYGPDENRLTYTE